MLNLSKLLNRLNQTITLSEWGKAFHAAREMRDCNRCGAWVESLLCEADMCKALAEASYAIDQLWNAEERDILRMVLLEICN